jgi:signal transduction histidine kinase
MNLKQYGSILVVDDDPDVLQFTSLLLQKHGYSTVPCSSSGEAMDVLKDKKVDVVLTDIVMPEISGIKLLEKMRNLYPETPVILMTGYADTDKAIEAIKKGAFDFITKPYKADYLIHSVERAVNYQRLIGMEKDYKNSLEELNQELETLVAERSMNLMALTMADRVRNPATTIAWVCKRMIGKTDVPEKLKEGFTIILSEAERLEAIVRDFHNFLKNKESMFSYEEINGVAEGVISVIEKEAAYKGVALAANLSGESLKINMEKNLFRAALFHVLRNALEATPSGGRVTVTTFGEGDNVVFEVSDTGHGISKEEIDKIFDPFFSTKQHRFGMGLSLSKQIVSEHMGEIKVESEIGKGTTCKMIFPARWMNPYSGQKNDV